VTPLGNGHKLRFGTDRWLGGRSPKELAPTLYRIALRKNYTVAYGLEGGAWKRGLQRITTPAQIEEFIRLWHLVTPVQLSELSDTTAWRFTANNTYSSRSAFRVQFMGAHADHEWTKLWKTNVKNKCKFFSWLLLQNKVWTAHRIIKHGGQTNAICQLCRTKPETALHIMAQCSFSRQIWTQLAPWIGITMQPPPRNNYRRLQACWTSIITIGPNEPKDREKRFIYTTWNIWKDRQPTAKHHQNRC
jgi:hypothetical protein